MAKRKSMPKSKKEFLITNEQLAKLTFAIKQLLKDKGIHVSPSIGDIYRTLRGEMIKIGIPVEDEPPNPLEEPIITDLENL